MQSRLINPAVKQQPPMTFPRRALEKFAKESVAAFEDTDASIHP